MKVLETMGQYVFYSRVFESIALNLYGKYYGKFTKTCPHLDNQGQCLSFGIFDPIAVRF